MGREWWKWVGDGSYTGVREIELSYRDAIGSFSVVYDLNGKPFPGPKHPSKHSFTTIYQDEYLVSVSVGNVLLNLDWLQRLRSSAR
ncbi:hypothetical protein TIFTF001_037461 [Ficus carica]|uniref:Jacalin-type lectin domain-containing protein n=1 Tax=Ficus carica TaxID=3494 RepID=A0AA88JBV2_FICCA|nr:hypothetical protein TIFTF001_037461 [Ficus carica]